MNKNNRGFMSLAKTLAEWLKALATSVAILALIMIFIQPTSVINSSMLPNFIEGDRLLISSLSKPKRGDVVIFDSGIPLSESRWKNLNAIQRLFVKP
ncbi:MAG: S26 family signal peptidase, partial [Tissierellia bacterium]|nr:S26 family signal peptidase [Tissierellia bacterium]